MTWWESFKSHPQTPNALTYVRVMLSCALPFIIRQQPFIAFLVFIFAAWTDWWDGQLARKYKTQSDLGRILDPTSDKFLILIPLVLFARLGYYSIWWTVPILAREIFVTFCRLAWVLEGRAVAAEKLGKIKFGVQVSVITNAFLCMLLKETGFFEFFHALLYLQLFACLFITVFSGYTFMKSNFFSNLTPGFAKFVTAFGVGLIPYAPGTWGSLVGGFAFALTHWNGLLYILLIAGFTAAGWWAYQRLNLKKEEDPGYIVVDEVVGMMIAFCAAPLSPDVFLTGFLFFRVFDIFKPWPCRRAEKFHGYWGIMADDVVAGIYTRLMLLLVFRV